MEMRHGLVSKKKRRHLQGTDELRSRLTGQKRTCVPNDMGAGCRDKMFPDTQVVIDGCPLVGKMQRQETQQWVTVIWSAWKCVFVGLNNFSRPAD